jgi:hypothetical protein
MVTLVAFNTTQLRVEVPPGAMVEGDAVNVATLTGLADITFTSVVALADSLSVFVTVNLKT